MSWKIWNNWNSSLNHLIIRHFFASEFSYCLKRNRANVQKLLSNLVLLHTL